MTFSHVVQLFFILCLFLSIGKESGVHCKNVKWPQWKPSKKPYYDSICLGRFRGDCINVPFCSWHTEQSPTCLSNRYFSVGLPEPIKQKLERSPIPIEKLMFVQHFGLRLSEGSTNRIYYNIDVSNCASRCLRSSLGFPDDEEVALVHPEAPYQNADNDIKQPIARRCLSFDFYPFEDPKMEFPYLESYERGVCILHTETKDTARARNEDQGFSDAELFYKSHFSKRPFSALAGYYEVRDSRGGHISQMLNYNGPSSLSLGLSSNWGMTRWGIYHPNKPGYLPKPKNASIDCKQYFDVDVVDLGDPQVVNPDHAFRGAITPISSDQHCPGLMTKKKAIDLCAKAGATLCRNREETKLMEGRKLGCSYDNAEVWHMERSEGKNGKELAYPRCCATYEMPLRCAAYTSNHIEECASRQRNDDCVKDTSGTNLRTDFGFGKLLDIYREMCVEVDFKYDLSCKELLVQKWQERSAEDGESCVWCPAPGEKKGGGKGSCRPGSDYGICDTSADELKAVFGIKLRSYCKDFMNCNVAAKYTDLEPFIFPDDITTIVDSGDDETFVDECFQFNGKKKRCLELSRKCVWKNGLDICLLKNDPLHSNPCRSVTTKQGCREKTNFCKWKSGKCKMRSVITSGDDLPVTKKPTTSSIPTTDISCDDVEFLFPKQRAKQCAKLGFCRWRPNLQKCEHKSCFDLAKKVCTKTNACQWVSTTKQCIIKT